MNIVVRPEVGETAWCFGKIRAVNGYPYMEEIQGCIEDANDEYVMVQDISYKIAIHRITDFTFGGVRTPNKKFDLERTDKENKDMWRRLGGKTW